MRQIYAQAGRMIVWLGDDREDGPKGLRWINHLAGQQYTVIGSAQCTAEELLDQGTIAIVPIPGAITQQTTWRRSGQIEGTAVNSRLQTGTLNQSQDNRQLTFLSNARPHRRYLYFRFIISFLNAKQQSLITSASIQTKRFWPSGGEYLNGSTLKKDTLAMCIWFRECR
ncbi:unnamed protein product [Penicillium salamii]|uniref:Uncharacterized protein n=1 Tax=Penicillium salamii TaxID=1612424 RepID=A0A9W4JNF0_9EURO|nr:unnamed protein product [Penicillium salamii]CAG8296772.1 unnamed protein product [Penicillium salamii]CAG8352072.1 unnamed protein product [Penicillium salamii]CAG8358907.1 unnamed protein product [Penicillium salamii]CAG8381396.1 unnamed protein product [Penicillium salamii]